MTWLELALVCAALIVTTSLPFALAHLYWWKKNRDLDHRFLKALKAIGDRLERDG